MDAPNDQTTGMIMRIRQWLATVEVKHWEIAGELWEAFTGTKCWLATEDIPTILQATDLSEGHFYFLLRAYDQVRLWAPFVSEAERPPLKVVRVTMQRRPDNVGAALDEWLARGRPTSTTWDAYLEGAREDEESNSAADLDSKIRIAEKVGSWLQEKFAKFPKTKNGNISLAGLGKARAKELSDALQFCVTLKRCADGIVRSYDGQGSAKTTVRRRSKKRSITSNVQPSGVQPSCQVSGVN